MVTAQPNVEEFVIDTDSQGRLQFVYDDRLAFLLTDLDGEGETKRASHVEPNGQGKWTADMTPVGGPVLGPFDFRKDALTAEVVWLQTYYLGH